MTKCISPVDIDFEVKGEPNGMVVAPFIFIPFVENAIKHGLTEEKNSFLKILFDLQPDQINFQIENAKPNLPNQNKVGGIGLKNVKRRLELLYPNQYILKVDDQGKNYKVNLTLNLST